MHLIDYDNFITYETAFAKFFARLEFNASVYTKDLLQDIAPTLLEFTATGLKSERSYKFRISQVSKGGQSIPSDPTSPTYLLKAGQLLLRSNKVLIDCFILLSSFQVRCLILKFDIGVGKCCSLYIKVLW